MFRRESVSTLAVDMSLCVCAVVLAAASMPASALSAVHRVPHATTVFALAVGFALITALMFACLGLYRPVRLGLSAVTWRTMAAGALGGYLAYLPIQFVTDRVYADQLVWLAIEYLAVGLVACKLAGTYLRKGANVPRVLILGTGPDALAVAADFRESKSMRRNVVGFYATSAEHSGASLTGSTPVFRNSDTIVDLVREHRVQEIVVAVRDQRGGAVPMDQLLACRIQGIPVLDLAGCYERAKAEVPLDSLKASWLVYGRGFAQDGLRMFTKRVFDIVGSALLLLLCAPVMLITMIAIRLDSAGPAIYRQERVGLGGKVFMCMKFRSMRVDAERDGVARWAAKNDSRVTRIGTFIRRTRIDELPQLLSVLQGEMSLVGPRPERPGFVADLREKIPFYDLRHSIKPGVTGWAQVRYGYGASLEDARRKHQFDLYYVKNNSLVLDLLTLIETVSVVLFREGQ